MKSIGTGCLRSFQCTQLFFFKTSAEVIINVSSTCSKFLSGRVGMNDKFSFVKTLTKKSFKTSALSFPE